ncbi:PGF-CTERM sorting domain-containing protein [Halobellus inordinatus]|uniref:PGF-CTERM sorting domain-containing protein n=1 Tax=Halobellus inordinatus TaxID=1126236 RepID=UPI00210B5C9A|nr:PGF-CTERM sorting domain-containing protein [Halobellus inordinatus]
MFTDRVTASVIAVLLVASALGSAAAVGTVGAATSSQKAYAETNVSFDTTSNAVVDYAVDGETVMQSVKVQSQSETESSGSLSADVELSASSDIAGAAVAFDAKSETSASMSTDSGATLRAHDNERGVLTVRAGDDSQYVAVNLSSSAEAASQSSEKVVVTTDDGTEGVFLVVGDGELTVNDQGNVSASLEGDSKLAFRSYPEGRTEDDEQQEQLITSGQAAAEVYVMQQSESGSEAVADVVQYGDNTTVEVTQQSEGTVRMTAERSEHQGKVVITSVSEKVVDATNDVQVTVDGEAAAQASSYSALQSAIDGGDTSKFLVRQQASADASASVLVAVNHFSEREITMTESETTTSSGTTATATETDSTTTASETTDEQTAAQTDESTSSTSSPGFGVTVALAALVGAALYAARQS